MKYAVKIEIVNEIIKLNTCRILDRIIEEWNEKNSITWMPCIYVDRLKQ